jgi:hypothetical protein
VAGRIVGATYQTVCLPKELLGWAGGLPWLECGEYSEITLVVFGEILMSEVWILGKRNGILFWGWGFLNRIRNFDYSNFLFNAKHQN